jgi:hypothetical protein
MVRNMFGLAFTAGTAAIFLIVTGIIGWQPPPNLNFHDATWRRGVWARAIKALINPRAWLRSIFAFAV